MSRDFKKKKNETEIFSSCFCTFETSWKADEKWNSKDSAQEYNHSTHTKTGANSLCRMCCCFTPRVFFISTAAQNWSFCISLITFPLFHSRFFILLLIHLLCVQQNAIGTSSIEPCIWAFEQWAMCIEFETQKTFQTTETKEIRKLLSKSLFFDVEISLVYVTNSTMATPVCWLTKNTENGLAMFNNHLLWSPLCRSALRNGFFHLRSNYASAQHSVQLSIQPCIQVKSSQVKPVHQPFSQFKHNININTVTNNKTMHGFRAYSNKLLLFLFTCALKPLKMYVQKWDTRCKSMQKLHWNNLCWQFYLNLYEQQISSVLHP